MRLRFENNGHSRKSCRKSNANSYNSKTSQVQPRTSSATSSIICNSIGLTADHIEQSDHAEVIKAAAKKYHVQLKRGRKILWIARNSICHTIPCTNAYVGARLFLDRSISKWAKKAGGKVIIDDVDDDKTS
ncbi:hypothetical protein BC938DRAFT_477978 [Jimgerdemannia flammicorona]|uniref:Uncharacterized protein n=1 Tax=Jimgerdemannia flammicorona TaxID=994334 RepID=A0A433QNK7_9FUNG|nr:hypothetical protein BC938DRAFT_477978 [Jimgerdemannia flammicorona]